jgi:hypothetical protein
MMLVSSSGAFRPWQSQRFAKFPHQLRGGLRKVKIVGVGLDADSPDEGFFYGFVSLVAQPQRVLYLGGIAHLTAMPVRISGEQIDRQPFGYLLRRRLPKVMYEAVANFPTVQRPEGHAVHDEQQGT